MPGLFQRRAGYSGSLGDKPLGIVPSQSGDHGGIEGPLGMRIPIANCDQTGESGSFPGTGILAENHR
jgi:hypothetical protein